MTVNRFYTITSIFLVTLLGYLTYKILDPFLNSIAWAIVFAIVFYPLYISLLKYMKYKSLASAMTVSIIILIILGPFTYLSFLLVDDIRNFLEGLNSGTFESLKNILTNSKISQIVDGIQSNLGMEGVDFGKIITENIKKIGHEIVMRLSSSLKNVTIVFLNFIFMLFAVFFFLRDGPGFLSRIRDYLPFPDEDKNRLISKVKDMIISTVYGGVVVALVQGLIGGITFYLLGIPSAVLWGAAISVMSFLPMLGTFSVWGPMTGYLFIQGLYGKGIILLIVGSLGISMVDNILKPIIISGRTKMPTLAVFFSVLGGIKIFGFIGFIMGPLVLALFISVFEIFRHIEGGENA
ncbi:MAG: AI-2E family transporter [Nitrospirae bacterium]|nr:AI-2E family transporter [Nitrospirota bacterium]